MSAPPRVRRAAAFLAARPVTVALVAIVLVTSLVAFGTRLVGGPEAAAGFVALFATGTGPVFDDGRWWTVVTYPFTTLHPRDLLFALLVVAVLCGFVEPRTPRSRLLGAALVGVLAGAVTGLALEAVSDAYALGWFPEPEQVRLVDPESLAVAVALAGSNALGPVWRRRLRVFVLVALLLGVVYLGQLDEFVRAGSGVAGLLFGLVAVPRAAPGGWRRSDAHETRVLLAAVTAMLGAGPLSALFAPHGHSLAAPLAQLLLGGVGHGPRTNECRVWDVTTSCIQQENVSTALTPGEALLSALPWLVFLVVAWGIWRGRRIAIVLGIAANLVVVALVAYYWILAPDADASTDVLASRVAAEQFVVQVSAILVIHVVAAAALWFARESCPLPPDRARAFRALGGVAVTAVVLLVGYVLFVLATPEAWTTAPTLAMAVADAPERLLPPALLVATPVAFAPVTPLATIVSGAIGPVFEVVLLVGCWRAMADVDRRTTEPPAAELHELLHRGGGGSIAHMALWPGMRAWIDERTGACVSYRVEQQVAIALGAPFGAPDADPVGVLQRFATYADTNGLVPCVYSISMDLAPAFEAIGWRMVEVAEESVIPLEGWEMKGKKWQDVRSSINRADREGVEVRWTRFDELTVGELKQVQAISEEWAGDKALPEMGFTLGGVAEMDDVEVAIALAVDAEGGIQAVTSWLPVWRDGELVGRTLDVMRRRPDSMNGVMEMLIARVALRLQERGAEYLSLSAAPLASSVGGGADAGDATILKQLLEQLGASLEPLYGFRSLLNFKRKFQPVMQPLGLVYLEPVHLPAIGLALSQAYLPGVTVGRLVEAVRQRGDADT